jgi:hypothetical protein
MQAKNQSEIYIFSSYIDKQQIIVNKLSTFRNKLFLIHQDLLHEH